MSDVQVFVPADAAAVSVGSDQVADALAQHPQVQLVRTGSRGMLWAEPLVEVATEAGRVGYPNVNADEVPGLIRNGMLAGENVGKYLGVVDQHPWLASQHRITFARVGIVDPSSLTDYQNHGGWRGLRRAFEIGRAATIEEVNTSGLRGRGGAGFPAGIKWQTVANSPSEQKYICCNFDEGDSGTFADRMIVEGDPFTLFEGMLIAAFAVGATEGFVYVRSEYPHAIAALRRAVDTAYAHGFLGDNIMGSGVQFNLHVRVGAGAYICGEESSMLESLEGRRGEVRARPPLPAISGLFNQPTLVHNVLSLCSVPAILSDSGESYATFGTGKSLGTQVFQLGGNIAKGGIIEREFGLTIDELLYQYGEGTLSGRPVRAVQIGGPLGAYLPPTQFSLPLEYEALAEAGAMLGHGGVVVFDDTVDLAVMARFAFEFCVAESCGKCTPCRIGSQRGVETMDLVLAGVRPEQQLMLLDDLCETMTQGSLCAMGGLTPMPVQSAIRHFRDDFVQRASEGGPQ
jgi:formate dehydrogenase iron-sulfur subunit